MYIALLFNKKLGDWFDFEIQTTGVLLNDTNLAFLKDIVGVKVISVSVFDIFDDNNNLDIIAVKEKMKLATLPYNKNIHNENTLLIFNSINSQRIESIKTGIEKLKTEVDQ